MNLAAVRWISIPHAADDRGTLTAIEGSTLPFELKRVFYMHGVPCGCERGAHAHRHTQQVVVAAAGSFRMDVSDGAESRTFVLDDPNRGLYLPAMTWLRLYDFVPGTVVLVLCDREYVREHVVRGWDAYRALVRETPVTA